MKVSSNSVSMLAVAQCIHVPYYRVLPVAFLTLKISGKKARQIIM